jgi:hypothetical protein
VGKNSRNLEFWRLSIVVRFYWQDVLIQQLRYAAHRVGEPHRLDGGRLQKGEILKLPLICRISHLGMAVAHLRTKLVGIHSERCGSHGLGHGLLKVRIYLLGGRIIQGLEMGQEVIARHLLIEVTWLHQVVLAPI